VVIEKTLAECKVRSVKVTAKGKRMITFDLDWLHKVLTNADAFGYGAGAVIFRPKGSPQLFAVIEADLFLDLLVDAKSHSVMRVS
jgi:hypothetical protein